MKNSPHLNVVLYKGEPNEVEAVLYLTHSNVVAKTESNKKIQEFAYNSIEKIDTNTKSIKFTLKNGTVANFKRGLNQKNLDWDEFRQKLESPQCPRSPFTRGSSARDTPNMQIPHCPLNSKQLTINGHSNHHHDDSKDAMHRGIKNSGNSCYFNAILQALAGLPTFICDLKDDRVKEAFFLKEESCYKTFLQITNQCAERSQVPIDARKAQNAVSKHSKQFANKKQQDAHELLSTFLTILELEIFPFLKVKKDHYKTEAIKSLPIDQRPGLFCPTKRNFSFLIKKQFCCSRCHDAPEVVEMFRDLSLEIFDVEEDIDGWDRENLSDDVKEWIKTISNPPSVQDMLQFYFLPEKIERHCNKCGFNETIIKKTIASLPRILTLHIKRFIHSESGMKKLKCKIQVDDELQLDNKIIANPLQDTIIFDTNQLPKNKYSSESEEEEEEMIPEETEDVLKAKEWIERHNNNNEYEEKPSSQKAPLKRTLQEMESDIFQRVTHFPTTKNDNKPNRADKKKYEQSTDSESDESADSSGDLDESKDGNALQEEIDELMFSSETSNSSEDLNLKYRLKCIVHHLGAKVTSGHYTAEILDHWKDVWFRYNDSKVTKSAPEMKACESAYILFYVHDSCWPQLEENSSSY